MGLAALGCLRCCLPALVPSVTAMFFGSILAADLDSFTDELTLPENVDLLGPTTQPRSSVRARVVGFQAALIATLETTGTSDASFIPSITALGILYSDYPTLLKWNLSA